MDKTAQLFETHDDYASGAVFSPCRTWRYVLWRRWQRENLRQAMFIGLNPSTADERQDDPTIRRCIRFCRDWGYGGYVMMNAYGFRATDPKVMQAASDPVGPGNDEALRTEQHHVELIVAAWGVHITEARQRRIMEIIEKPIYCLGTTKAGRPRHPLYIAADTTPVLFHPGE